MSKVGDIIKKVLFVCHGNICRSPMAEYVLKSMVDNCIIESRSTSREEIGNDIYPNVKEILIKNNIPFNRHYARQITEDDLENFDLIVYFDDNNLANLKKMFGTSLKFKKLLNEDILDPWYTRDFETCYNDIYKGCVILKEEIKGL